MTDKFTTASRNEIIAHLRMLLRVLVEKYATLQRDDVRMELIWADVEEYTRKIDDYMSKASRDRDEAQREKDQAHGDAKKGHEIIAGLNKRVIELQAMLRDGVPHVVTASRNVGNETELHKTRVERIQYDIDVPAFVIWEYDDKSGYMVSVRRIDTYDGDISWHELTRWYYLHKPSGAELMARLTTTQLTGKYNEQYVEEDDEE